MEIAYTHCKFISYHNYSVPPSLNKVYYYYYYKMSAYVADKGDIDRRNMQRTNA